MINEKDLVSSQSPAKDVENEDSMALSEEARGEQQGPEPTEKEHSMEYSVNMEQPFIIRNLLLK